MTTDTTETRNERSTRSVAWLATAIGASIGIAALAYKRRQRSPLDRFRRRANQVIDVAREEVKPWMGAAAGTAAAGTALAVYMRNRRESGWQRAGKRASNMASHVRTHA